MRGLRLLSLALLLVLSVAIGFWLLFPWQQATQVAFEMTAQRLAKRGVEVSSVEIIGEGGLAPRFELRGLSLSHPFLTVKATSAEGRIKLLSSLLSLAPVIDIRLGSGEFLLAQGSRASWKNGAFLLRARADEIRVSRLELVGEVGLKGKFSYSVPSSSLAATELELTVPPELDDLMTGLRAFIPLRKEAEGRWKVEKP